MQPSPLPKDTHSDSSNTQIATHQAPPQLAPWHPLQSDPSKQKKARIRNLAISCAVLLVLTVAFPWFGLIISLSLMTWGGAAFKGKVRSPLSLFFRESKSPVLLSLGCTSLGVIYFIVSIIVLGQRWQIERREAAQREAALAAQQQAQREAVLRLEHLRSQSDAAAKQWSGALDSVESLLNQGRPHDAYSKLEAAKKDVPQLDLTPVPPSIAALLPRHQALESRLKPIEDALHNLETLESQRGDIKQAMERKDWLAVMGSLQSARGLLALLREASPEAKRFFPSSVSLERYEEQLKKTERLAEPKAARLRREIERQAEKERKQRAMQEAYEALCGPKPGVSAWDGEVAGIERALKKVAHDPDSIDVENCTDPIMTEKHCWVTSCDVRGKNMFGAKILQRKRFSVSKVGVEDLSSD